MTADGHTKGTIKRTALHALMDGHRRIDYEREELKLYKSTRSHSTAQVCDSAGTPGRAQLPQRRQQVPRRPAKTVLLALLTSMAMFGESLELSPFDNPFALLGMRRVSIETAMQMTNKDYEKAFRTASRIMHPDKVKDRSDVHLQAMMAEQFRKAQLAKELLCVPPEDPVKLEQRHSYIRRFLWTERELEQEGRTYAEADDSMIGEDAMRDNFQQNLTKKYGSQAYDGAAIRVLPGVGVLQGHLLQAFNRRGLRKNKKSDHLTQSTAGFAQEKSLAIVQRQSLLMF
jgi:hypothetical protein